MTHKTHTVSDEALQNATGKSWTEWFSLLDAAGAKNMPHKDIARWLYDQKLVTSGWWCQSITVGYEQHIGRREIGQTNRGDFQVTTSKTLELSLDKALERWLHKVNKMHAFNSIPLTGKPHSNKTESWRYWYATLADETRIVVTIGMKDHSQSKSILAITQEKIANKTDAAAWKLFWKTFLSDL